MKKQNAAIVALLLLLLSYIILADDTKDFSWDDITSYTQTSYPAHKFVYCDNFYRKEKNYTLQYPKILNLDAVKPCPGELDEGGLTLMSKYNYIEKIENGAFDNYTNLRALGITLNSLQYIDNKVLTETVATSLNSLYLKSNNLQNLPTTAFQYLKNLRSLDLSYNPRVNLWVPFNGVNITVLHEALSNLIYLDISYCNIGHFDDDVFVNLKKLQMLRMSGNPITFVPIAIKSLTTLQDLHIKDSKIVTIDDCDLCNLTKLRILDFSNTKTLSYIHENAFGAITNAPGDTPQLKEFSIESCNIQIIPEKLLNWNMLEKFDIHHNPLKCDSSNAWLMNDIVGDTPSLLTPKIVKSWNWSDKNFLTCNSPKTSKWSLLHILFGNMCFNGTAVYDESEIYDSDVYYVCDNKNNEWFPCKFLNENDFECHSGRTHTSNHDFDYILYNANIKILQKNFTLINANLDGKSDWETKLTVLQTDKVLPGHESTVENLSFKDNKIATIENGTFDKFVSLKVLYLSRNEITDINGLTFPPSLTQLYLNANNLKLISSKPLENLVELNALSLSENPNVLLANSASTFFPSALSKLQYLGLRRCNITTLDNNIFVNLVSLEYLYLGENPITSIPTAINALQNLKHLNISSSPNLTVLHWSRLITNPNLKQIIAFSSNIQRIEFCAFCSFPNLEFVDLDYNTNLTYIDRNALKGLCDEEFCQLGMSLKGCKNLIKQDYAIDCNCFNDDSWTLMKYYNLICISPPKYIGRRYNAINDELCRRRRK